MKDGVWPLMGAATMRALDRHTIETLGVPAALLMESAGRAVAQVALSERAPRGGDVLVVCGGGNNGGDGLVAARHLALLGVPVRVALVAEPKRLAPDTAANLARARAVGVPVETGAVRTAGAGLIVDALFGTGLTRRIEGAPAAAIRRVEAARERSSLGVVAVDLPSGLDSDTGQCHGPCVTAHVTVAIALPKLGLALEPGRTRAGRIIVARIGIADAAPGVRADAELWSANGAARRLPVRPPAGHKGTFGHVLLIAGARGTTGAAALAAEAAARVGAGLVTIACPAGVNEILEVKCTEMMTAPVPDGAEGGLAAAALDALLALAHERDVVALGPGIGRAEETQKLVRELVARIERPLVVDADGLYPFAAPRRARSEGLGALKARRAATILTPHPGEAARLLGTSAADINRDRVGSARRLAELSGAVVVLKGAATVVAAPEGRVAVNPTGGPALGTGGTGDVLTGVIAGLLAQQPAARGGVDRFGGAFETAVLGAWLHGKSGDRLARHRPTGVLAGEVANELPGTIDALRREGRPGIGSGAALALPFP